MTNAKLTDESFYTRTLAFCCKSSLSVASEMRGSVTKSGCWCSRTSWLTIMQIDPSMFLFSFFLSFFAFFAKRGEMLIELYQSRHFIASLRWHGRLNYKYAIEFLTRSSSRLLASVYNYVWYCNIGAARFGWWAVFILRAEMLLLYHSSSADIPKRKNACLDKLFTPIIPTK